MVLLLRDENDMLILCSVCPLLTASIDVAVVFHFFVDAVFFIGQLVGADPANGR